MISAINVALLTSVSVFRFSGGGEQALVDQASDQLKRPIVMLALNGEFRRPFEFGYNDEQDAQRLFKVKSGFNVTAAGGLYPPAWPAGVGRVSYEVPYRRQFEAFTSKARFKNGRITIRTGDKEGATLTDLARLGFSRPLSWTPLYDRVCLRLNLKDATEKQLLAALTDATGTRLLEGKEGYRLETNAKQYRPRAIAMWQWFRHEGIRLRDPVLTADANYMLALLPATTDWLLQHGIDESTVTKDFARSWPAGTAVHTMAWHRAAAGFELNTASVAETFRRVGRPRDPVYGYILGSGEPKVGYQNSETHEVIEI